MNSLREKTIALRLKGYSYNEINRMLGVAKSTLSSWLKDIALPEEAQKRIEGRVSAAILKGLVKRNKEQTVTAQKRTLKIRADAAKEFKGFSKRDLFIMGLSLYWAEGYKRVKIHRGKERTYHPISLTNSDPEIIRAFLLFMKGGMGLKEESIFVNLRLFPGMDTQKEIRYWSQITGIKKSHFDRPSFIISKSSQGVRPFNRLPHGTAQLRVANTNEFHRLMGWIEGMQNLLAQFSKKD